MADIARVRYSPHSFGFGVPPLGTMSRRYLQQQLLADSTGYCR